jgi:diadenosine tetraphosphate (Ap4A) HIT family hydrolase
MSKADESGKVKTIAEELKDILDFWDQENIPSGPAKEEKGYEKDLENIYDIQLPSIPNDGSQQSDEDVVSSDDNRRKNRLRDKINLREAYLRRKAEQREAEEVNLDFDILTGADSSEPPITKLDETTLSFQLGILDPSAEVDEPLEEQPFNEKCTLCKIKAEQISANVVYKDIFFTVILAPNGLRQGHLMIFPNGHYSQYMSIPASYHKVLHRLLPKLVLGLQKSDLQFDGVDFYFSDPIKQAKETRHYSINLIPRNKNDGLKISVNTKVDDDKKKLNTIAFTAQLAELFKVE